MLIKIFLYIFSTIFSINSFSNEVPQSSGYEKGFWLGIGSGVTIRENRLELINENYYGPTGKIEFGYHFHDNASLYSSYDYMDLVSDNKIHIGVLGLNANYFLTHNLSIFTNVGMSYYLSDSHNNLHYPYSYGGVVGTGIEYMISKSFVTKIGFNYYDNIKLASGDNTHLNQVYLGVVYNFGQKNKQIQPTVKKVPVPHVEYVDKIITENASDFFINNAIITFGLGQYKISNNTAPEFYLQEVVTLMKKMPKLKAQLKGRTDKTGTYEINKYIAAERVKSVYDYLVSAGIDAGRLSYLVVSYHDPITEDNNEIERSVEILFK
ncbi:OmpA family protein [Vibrio metschnikovii]|nr:OmpA family protein [Vibrio metschnikovii]